MFDRAREVFNSSSLSKAQAEKHSFLSPEPQPEGDATLSDGRVGGEINFQGDGAMKKNETSGELSDPNKTPISKSKKNKGLLAERKRESLFDGKLFDQISSIFQKNNDLLTDDESDFEPSDDVDELKGQVNKLLKERKEIKKNFKKAESISEKNAKESQKALDKLQQRIYEEAEEREELKELINEHTQDLKKIQDEKQEFFRENQKLRDEHREQSNLVTELTVDLEIIRNERDRAQMSTGSDQLEINALQNKIDELQRKNERIELKQTKTLFHVAELEKQAQETQEALEEIETNSALYRAKVAQLTAQLKEYEKLKSENIAMKQRNKRQIEKFRKEHQRLSGKLRSSLFEIDDLKNNELRKQTLKVEEYENKLKSYREEENKLAGMRHPWHWDADFDSCERCSRNFTVTRRRHHCRRCGSVICKKCTARRKVKVEGWRTHERVCLVCPKDKNRDFAQC